MHIHSWENWKLSFSNPHTHTHTPKILYFRRYIDDIIVLYDRHETEVEDLIKTIYNLHPSIEFTHETHQEEINIFLIL